MKETNVFEKIKGLKILPEIGSMKHKRNLITGKVVKYKSRLKLHYGKLIYEED